MITTGFTLACLTAAGFYMVFRKMPRKVRRFLQKHALFTDAVTCMLTYALFGGTLVALFAAAWMGLMVSMLLAITANPALSAALERFATKCGEMKEAFIAWLERMAPEVKGESPKLEVVSNGN